MRTLEVLLGLQDTTSRSGSQRVGLEVDLMVHDKTSCPPQGSMTMD